MNIEEITQRRESHQNESNPEEETQGSGTNSKSVLIYCLSEFCKGRTTEAEAKDFDKDLDCPICYVTLVSSKVSQLSCGHTLCPPCAQSFNNL